MKNKKLVIFGALAIGGLVATAVTTAWGSFKASEKLQNEMPSTKKEAVKLVWKYYIPAGIALGTTIIADICFYRIGMKELAALTASVSYLTANRDKLEKKLKEAVGEEKFEQIKNDIKCELVTEDKRGPKFMPGRSRFVAEETGYGDTLFLDGWSGRFFRSSLDEVLAGIKRFNDMYRKNPMIAGQKYTPVSWNDFYDQMHIVQTHLGWEFGYPANEDYVNPDEDLIDVDTDINMLHEDELMPGYRDIGEDIYVIEPHESPMLCWQEL